jgi:hypothetical protein
MSSEGLAQSMFRTRSRAPADERLEKTPPSEPRGGREVITSGGLNLRFAGKAKTRARAAGNGRAGSICWGGGGWRFKEKQKDR